MLYLANLLVIDDAIVEGPEHIRPTSIVTVLKTKKVYINYLPGTKFMISSIYNYQPLTNDNMPTFLTDEDILELL